MKDSSIVRLVAALLDTGSPHGTLRRSFVVLKGEKIAPSYDQYHSKEQSHVEEKFSVKRMSFFFFVLNLVHLYICSKTLDVFESVSLFTPG